MAQENTLVSFIGQKVSKICWCSDHTGGVSTREFYTSTYEETTNQISRWLMPDKESEQSEPEITCSLNCQGSVTDLLQLSNRLVAYSSDNGDISLASYDPANQTIKALQSWKNLHRYKSKERACCTCITYTGSGEIVSGGEDGRINIISVDGNKLVRTIENADSTTVTGLEFLSNKEIVSSNTTGQLKLWDVRTTDNESPRKVMSLSGNTCPILSISKHPNQKHILVTGQRDGVIGIWDIRQERSPVTLIDAHESEVWQVCFHPLYPDNLFTCSQDGSCWFWDGTSMMSSANIVRQSVGIENMTQHSSDNASSSMWLYIDANKHKMETFSLLPFNTSPVNCFDVRMNKLICATDNDALIVVEDIPVHS